MIRLIDRTLSCLDAFYPTEAQFQQIAELLLESGADVLELSEQAYHSLETFPERNKCLLRLENSANASKYPDVGAFVCAVSPGQPISDKIRVEVRINDMHESYTLTKSTGYPHVRIRGLDDILLGNYESDFRHLKKLFLSDMEFCPSNRAGCASAIAIEWLLSGSGKTVVTSFGGIGGFAAFEEVVMALRIARQRKVGRSYPQFPKLRGLLEEITKVDFSVDKPIIGRNIFFVKSGIHVDGILKQPRCYAPFLPEEIGQKHTIVLGKQSGKSSILYKLKETGISMNTRQVQLLLKRVKEAGVLKNDTISDKEFSCIINEILSQNMTDSHPVENSLEKGGDEDG